MATRGRRVWITGATSGIGKGLATALAKAGNTVIISGRRAEILERMAAADPQHLIPMSVDVVDQQALDITAAAIEERFGALDTLIVNAGTVEYVDVEKFDSEIFDRVFEVNFFGAVRTVAAALPILRGGIRPYIVLVSSVAAYLGLPRAQAYGASKAAVSHFAESLRADLYTRGIDVSIVSPGFVRTPMTDANDFDMPMMIDVDEAVRSIERGMQARRLDIRFPPMFAWGMRLISKLPGRVRLWVAKRFVRA